MILKSFKYILLTGVGLLLCSCNTYTPDREYDKNKQINNEMEQQKIKAEEQSKPQNIKCPPDKPMEQNGKCYPCDDWDNDYSKEECDKCPERVYKDGLCVFTRSPYPEYPLMYFTAIGDKDRSTRNGTNFEACDTMMSIKTTLENCSQCPNRKYKNGECFLSECPQGYFRDLLKQCIKCSTTWALETNDKEECDKCPERVYKEGLCILKECPKEAAIRQDGHCLDCERIFEQGEVEESECLKCPNRKYVNGECTFKE